MHVIGLSKLQYIQQKFKIALYALYLLALNDHLVYQETENT